MNECREVSSDGDLASFCEQYSYRDWSRPSRLERTLTTCFARPRLVEIQHSVLCSVPASGKAESRPKSPKWCSVDGIEGWDAFVDLEGRLSRLAARGKPSSVLPASGSQRACRPCDDGIPSRRRDLAHEIPGLAAAGTIGASTSGARGELIWLPSRAARLKTAGTAATFTKGRS